MAKSIRFYYCR